MKRIAYITLLIVAAMAIAACHRRPLHDMEERITLKVTVDVDTVCNIGRYIYNDQLEVPNTNTDMLRLFIYDKQTHKQIGQKLISNKSYDEAGHQVFTDYLNISYGTYDFLVYNFDTPNTFIKEENDEDAILAYTTDVPKAVSNYFGGQAATYQPDHLMVAQEQQFYVAPHTELPTLEMVAHTCINTYYIQIHVEGLQFVSGCSAIISGLYNSNKFGCESTSPWTVGQRIADPATSVYFTMEKGTDKNIAGDNKDVLCAVFNTFGKIEDQHSNLYVVFNAVDAQGNRLQKSVSLDQVFRTENALQRHWLLLEDTWVIDNPQPDPVNSGGFQPSVDDWEEQYGEIEL